MKRVVVTLTDSGYYHKVKRTIADIRSRGEWTEDVVLITVGFDAPQNFLDFYRVIPFRIEHVDTSYLLEQYRICPIRPTCDNREFTKLTQWDKFAVFDQWFKQWNRVIFFDAGLRIVDSIHYLADLPCEGVFMAPDDCAPYDETGVFSKIIEVDRNPLAVERLFKEYPQDILKRRYFLNCIWMYDTALLNTITFSDLVQAMNHYPICRCNEMTIMNLLFTMKHNVWRPFPEWVEDKSGQKKRLFGWSECNDHYGHHNTWRNFCFLKYALTINFECE
jgi:hypothetical protein